MPQYKTFTQVMAELPEERRQRILKRAEELDREYRALRALRKALGKSQAEVAREMGVSQPSVAQMEKRRDWMLSTLAAYVEALGGRLRLIVELPGQPPIHLDGVDDLLDTEEDEAADVATKATSTGA